MERLTQLGHRESDWAPGLEKTGTVPGGLPSGKILGVTLRTQDLTWNDVNSRGVTHCQLDDAPNSGKLHTVDAWAAVYYSNSIGKPQGVSAWTDTEAYNFGRNLNHSGLSSEQFGETHGGNEHCKMSYGFRGEEQYSANKPQLAKVYEGMRDAVMATTPKGYLVGGYDGKVDAGEFKISGVGPIPLDSAFTGALASPSAARSGLWWFQKPVSRFALTVVQGYPARNTRRRIWEYTYALQRCALASSDWFDTGYENQVGPILYTWPGLEGHVDGHYFWDYHFGFENILDGGILLKPERMWASFNLMLSIGVPSFIFGRGMYVWESGERYSDGALSNYNEVPISGRSDVWLSTAGASQPPPTGSNPRVFSKPNGVFNFPWVAANWYARMRASGGNNFLFRRFRVNGGAWFTPTSDPLLNNPEILRAAAALRGFCLVTQSGSTCALYYSNPNAPMGGETVEAELPGGGIVTFDCYGPEPVCIIGLATASNVTANR